MLWKQENSGTCQPPVILSSSYSVSQAIPWFYEPSIHWLLRNVPWEEKRELYAVAVKRICPGFQLLDQLSFTGAGIFYWWSRKKNKKMQFP